MHTRRTRTLAVIAASVVSGTVSLSVSGGPQMSRDRALLSGLDGVRVTTESIGEHSDSLAATLASDTELQLRRAGIRILGELESGPVASTGRLVIQVETLPACEGTRWAVITLKVRRVVRLLRNNEYAEATMWEPLVAGPLGDDETRGARALAGGLVNQFIEFYFAANPRK